MRNALHGYSYQHYVAFWLIAKMDVEREFQKITLEALVNHQFDDVKIETDDGDFYVQIKDIKNIDLDSIAVAKDRVLINKVLHKLSTDINIIFFKEINYEVNSEVFGLPAHELGGVYIVSLSRGEIDKKLNRFYQKNPNRKIVMEQFFAVQMDNRVMEFEKFQLPLIKVYSTHLLERTVKISRKLLEFKNLLFVEGKPGSGKSHLVGALQDQFKNNVLYRFWISNQDATYEERLKYINFLTDLSKKLFADYKDHTETEIMSVLRQRACTLIIDGLDHVENYNPKELQCFINFIERAQEHCKIIVLSRPLFALITWKKQLLTNWNVRQTRKVLTELYQIEDYSTTTKIYELTSGYPILVSYIAQQYKLNGSLSQSGKFESINAYYDILLKSEKGKQSLSLFLCSRGFLMRSELKLFLSDYPLTFVEEFIYEHPYLFEIRLNRISLFHDSLITYLRMGNINYAALRENFNRTVYTSLLKGERRFQSRIGHFDLSLDQIKTLVKKYSSVHYYKKLIVCVIDFEAIREFYQQLRNMLALLDSADLEFIEYYDLALIINLIQRDHVSTINEFQFTYVKTLLFNGYDEEEITSNKYLFAMWYYLKTKDSSLLLNATSDDMYDTDNFHSRLNQELDREQNFFKTQETTFSVKAIHRALDDTASFQYRENLEYILVNLYLHQDHRSTFHLLYKAIQIFMQGHKDQAISLLIVASKNQKFIDYHQAWFTLKNAKKTILAQGGDPEKNDYLHLSLKKYLAKHGKKGSFTLWPEVLSYLRLSLKNKKKIDISAISIFWNKYYQRKDYSLYALDSVLTVFEKKNWITWQSSIKLITEIQDVSEKGYRGLLARYIMDHTPKFINLILTEFLPNDLKISWFDLEPQYLDLLPEEICVTELIDTLKYNYNENVSIDKIDNLLNSNKLNLLKKYLGIYNCRVRISFQDQSQELLKKLEIAYIEEKKDDRFPEKESAEKRFDQGTLDNKNIKLIKNKKLTLKQVAAMADGDYTALSEPKLFRQFSKARVKREFKEILFSGITSKSKFSDYHHNLWIMPGSVLKIMMDNNIAVPKSAYHSFKTYLALSLIDLEVRKNS